MIKNYVFYLIFIIFIISAFAFLVYSCIIFTQIVIALKNKRTKNLKKEQIQKLKKIKIIKENYYFEIFKIKSLI